MSRHFFSGGTMPRTALPGSPETWSWKDGDGRAALRSTSECWLENLDYHRNDALSLFGKDLSMADAHRTFYRWRIFFLACAETFAFGNGQEWWVSHYLFRKP